MDSALHYTSVSHAHTLVGNINKMRLATNLCDVTVVVGNFRIMAHRVVLSACTPYFYQMFYTTPKPPSEYRLDNVDETSFLKIIEFCYTSAISVTPELAWPLLSAAALVELPEICGLCCDLLASDLSLSTCLAMHLSAARLSQTAAAQLLKASSQFLEENATELSTSQQLFDLSEQELVELFKSLSQSSALACIKLATSWLSRSEASIQTKVVDQLKQNCPYLDDDLTDFATQILALSSVKNPCVNGKDDKLEGSSSTTSSAWSNLTFDKSSMSPHQKDSGYTEALKRTEKVSKEDEQQHMCVGCGDTFDSRAELLAHRKRECEDESDQAPQLKEISLPEGTTKDEQKVCMKQITDGGSSENLNQTDTVPEETNVSGASDSCHGKETCPSKEEGLSGYIEGNSQANDLGESGSLAAENLSKSSGSVESTEDKRAPESLDANDSNNNDINAKFTIDADSSDDIDVVNDDDTDFDFNEKLRKREEESNRDYGGGRHAYPVYADRQRLRQDDAVCLKCQFCGISVFDDEEELQTHWKEVHGVCQDTSQQHTESDANAGLHQPLDGNAGLQSYLKRSYCDEEDQEMDAGGSLKKLAKQPKLDESNGEHGSQSLQVKKEFLEDSETKLSSEQWLAKYEGQQRAKVGQDGNMAGFLQYMQQYNELAKWYMDQGFSYCNLCMVYHAKNSECPKSHINTRHISRDAQDLSSFNNNEGVLDLKREQNHQEQESKGFNGTDIENVGKGKKPSANVCEEEEEEEGPLDMSKTSQDFTSSSAQYSTRHHSAKPAAEAQKERSSHQSQDSQYLSQHQVELAQYYSRMMAAVAAVSVSPSGGNTDTVQYGLAGPYSGSVPSGFAHSALYMPPSASSTSDGLNKMAMGTGYQNTNSAHSGGPEINIYGTSVGSSPLSSLSNKAYGKHFKVPSDISPYSPQPTPAFHRKQQNFHSAAHSLQDSSSEESHVGSLNASASTSSFSLPAGDVTGTNQSSSNGKSQSRRKPSSRQGFPCTVCNRVFSYQAALFTHMRVHSPSARTYQCQLCHQTFDRAPDLKVHVCPNGVEKPYVCPSCGQTFAKNIHLKRHLATHSGLKPYPCWVCGKRFSRSDHLKRHTQSIHAGSRPHGCQLCGKEFVRKYELNKHMLTHTNVVAGEQGEDTAALPANHQPQTSPKNLREATIGSPRPLTMHLPVTCSTVSS